MRERDIEAYLVKRVQAMGGEVRKVQFIGRRGAPDRLVMLPGFRLKLKEEGCDATPGSPRAVEWLTAMQRKVSAALPGSGRTVWVELKAPGKVAKSHQAREHARLREMGQHVVVIDSLQGVEELLA